MTVHVISDLHLDEHGQARLFDDERQGRLLAELCAGVEREEGSELVLLGDCFDFTAMQPPPKGLERFFRSLDVPREAPPRRTLPELLSAVRASNPVAFEALAQLARKARVTLVPGNHDHHLAAPEAAAALAAAGIEARLETWLSRELGGSKVVLLHGHELDEGNEKPGGSGEVMTNVLHQAVIPYLQYRGPPPNLRFDPDRVVALRPEEAVVSVLQRWLPEDAFRKFFRAFLRLLAENGYLPGPLAWLANFVSANRVRSSIARHDQLWERTGLRAIDALKGKAALPHQAPRPDALVLGHTHVIDWAVHGGRLYVNLGTWTERAFDASSPRDTSLPVLRLDAPEGRLRATLTDLAAGAKELQRFDAGP
ncbi:MAG TPA: metallophosphoesterase [Myxococcales bacterium]|nr:metallophosphoesterase [Myxococcales bacterium]